MNEGENLSAIWQKNFNLPAYLISSINIAEHTGLLAEALKDTGVFLAKEYELKQKLRLNMYLSSFFIVRFSNSNYVNDFFSHSSICRYFSTYAY